ncbi:MAG: DUF748 domain-containing protein [Endomicrobiales bacterium]
MPSGSAVFYLPARRGGRKRAPRKAGPMKKLLILLAVFVLVVLPLTAYLFRNLIVKEAAEWQVKKNTSYGLAIGSVSFDPFKGALETRDARVLNPRGFAEPVMMVLPEVRVAYEPRSLFAERKHFGNVLVTVSEIVVVRNKDGAFNLAPLTERRPGKKAEKEKPLNYRIDRLNVKVGRVTYTDYRLTRRAVTVNYAVNIDENYTGVTSIDALVKDVLGKVLKRIDIKALQGLDLENLPGAAQDALDALTDEAKKKAPGAGKGKEERLKEMQKQLLDKAKELEKEKK